MIYVNIRIHNPSFVKENIIIIVLPTVKYMKELLLVFMDFLTPLKIKFYLYNNLLTTESFQADKKLYYDYTFYLTH